MSEYAAHAAEARLLSADLTAPEDLRAARSQRRLAETEHNGGGFVAQALARAAGFIPRSHVRKDAA